MMTGRVARLFGFVAVLGVVLWGNVESAQGELVQWNLKDVTFDDGGTASGFFTVDTATVNTTVDRVGRVTDFDIKTTAGHTYPSDSVYAPANITYTFVASDQQLFYTSGLKPSSVVFFQGPNVDYWLRFLFDKDVLTTATGTAQFVHLPGAHDEARRIPPEEYAFRDVNGGSITAAIPEPSTFVILVAMLLGLAALVGFSARRSTKFAVVSALYERRVTK